MCVVDLQVKNGIASVVYIGYGPPYRTIYYTYSMPIIIQYTHILHHH